MLRRVAKGWRLLHTLVIVTLALSFGLVTSAAAASEHKAKKAHDRPAWLEKLETQIDYEEMMSGMEGRQDRKSRNTRLRPPQVVVFMIPGPLTNCSKVICLGPSKRSKKFSKVPIVRAMHPSNITMW